MTPILHRSLKSPYAQKTMALMGYLRQDYLSFIAPKGLPRPIEEKLVGGYCRRIPILQIGADMYCDTELITRVMAERTGKASLYAYSSQQEAADWVAKMEEAPFFNAFSPGQMVKAYFRNMPPRHAIRFILDRAKLAKSMPRNNSKTSMEEKRAETRAYLEELNQHLQGRHFMLSDTEPTSVDFTAFTIIYFHDVINNLQLAQGLDSLQRWYASMTAFGTGQFLEISGKKALKVAREASPAPIPTHLLASDRIGQHTTHHHQGFQAWMTPGVEGTVVGEDDNVIVLRRENKDVGTVHVHFPKLSYPSDAGR